MGRKKVLKFKCHKISGGSGRGRVLVSNDHISFYHADPKTGVFMEENHDLKGRNIAGKVLVFPAGKGSSVVQGEGLHQLTKHGTAPMALIIRHPDTVLVVGAVIWKMPLVDKVEEGFYEAVRNGSLVEVNADRGVITLLEEGT
jgi:predicted aconitase with swiveling domain